jgi:hypothetical protein
MAKPKDNDRHDDAEVTATEGLADRAQPQGGTLTAKLRKRGRKEPKLTVALGQRIIASTANGNFPSVTARMAGVNPDTLSKWLERGDRDEQPFRDFAEAYHRAELGCESILVEKWKGAAPDDWRAGKELWPDASPSAGSPIAILLRR